MKYKLSFGSALLLVFVISFVVSLAAMRCWQVSSLICDVQYQRELFYKRFYMTNRILNAGIDLACKNFDTFLKLKKTTDIAPSVDVNFCLTDVEIKNANIVQLTVSKFAPQTKQAPTRQVSTRHGLSKYIKKTKNIDLGKDCLLLSASLVNNNVIVCNLRCLLERNSNGSLNAEKKDQNDKGMSFVVSHFTLSSSL
ncbi:MAG: hypothetical protein V1646_01655 [bacterium]